MAARIAIVAAVLGMALGLAACGSGIAAAENDPAAAKPVTSAAQCGKKGQPDCPLQGWMKSTLQAYQRQHDHTRLAKAMSELAARAPAGFARWDAIASEGQRAAEAHDEDGVRAACKACHEQHRSRYRNELRAQGW